MDDTELSLEELRAKAIKEGKAFGKGRLRDQFRMKPKPDAKPLTYVKNPHNGSQYPIYELTECVEIQSRKKSDKPRTEKQIRAAKIVALKAKLRSREAKAGSAARDILKEESLVLDTETTGLDYRDQIIELAIVNHAGETVFDQRFKPTCEINPEAADVHGITVEILDDKPPFKDKFDEVKNLLLSKNLVIFNKDFDLGMLKSTCAAFGLDTDWIKELKTDCAMDLAAYAYGSTNRYGSISLSNATLYAGVEWQGEAHSALADSLATLGLIKNMASHTIKLEEELAALQNDA